jgi:hypothetical protein
MDNERITRAVDDLAAALADSPDAHGLAPLALRRLPDGRLIEVRVREEADAPR